MFFTVFGRVDILLIIFFIQFKHRYEYLNSKVHVIFQVFILNCHIEYV